MYHSLKEFGDKYLFPQNYLAYYLDVSTGQLAMTAAGKRDIPWAASQKLIALAGFEQAANGLLNDRKNPHALHTTVGAADEHAAFIIESHAISCLMEIKMLEEEIVIMEVGRHKAIATIALMDAAMAALPAKERVHTNRDFGTLGAVKKKAERALSKFARHHIEQLYIRIAGLKGEHAFCLERSSHWKKTTQKRAAIFVNTEEQEQHLKRFKDIKQKRKKKVRKQIRKKPIVKKS